MTMTVKELKTLLNKFDDNLQVEIECQHEAYRGTEELEISLNGEAEVLFDSYLIF